MRSLRACLNEYAWISRLKIVKINEFCEPEKTELTCETIELI